MIKDLIMNKIYLLVLASWLIVFSACDDFFEKNPYDSTGESIILTNEQDAQTLLYGMYAHFKSGNSYGGYLTNLPDIMTDAALATAGFTNQMGAMYSWYINPGMGEVEGIWANHYASIVNTNYLINGIDQIDGDEAELNRIKGEAYIGRALIHYNLVRLFGAAYDVTTASTDLGVPYMLSKEPSKPERNTVQEVYDYIESDLLAAVDLMESGAEPDNVFFTESFAYGLLARVALDMKAYDEVIRYASEVIANSGAVLLEGNAFENLWLEDVGDEIIWKVGYTKDDFGGAPGYNYFNRNDMEEGKPQPDYIPANWLLDLYNKTDDIRFTTYYVETETNQGWTGTLINKFPTNPMFDRQGVNMPKPMRLAEMYLLRAEAYANSDEDGLAAADLDALLSTRITNHAAITLTGQDLKDFIFNERLRELAFEGFYWFDLKRHGFGFERVPQAYTYTANDLKITADDYRWLWPIPITETNGNDNINQNDDY